MRTHFIPLTHICPRIDIVNKKISHLCHSVFSDLRTEKHRKIKQKVKGTTRSRTVSNLIQWADTYNKIDKIVDWNDICITCLLIFI